MFDRKAYKKKWDQIPENKLKSRIRGWKNKNIDITIDQYNRMLKKQNGCCKICGDKEKLVIDHDHSTGQIRAILCNRCNLCLGNWGEDIKLLKRAIIYLRMEN